MKKKLLGMAIGMAMSGSVLAGPVVIDGTDANDHGSASGGVNLNGWEYMQRVLENLASAVNPAAAKVVVDLGTSSSTARAAINSAFALSSLPGAGWSLLHVDGVPAMTSWLTGLSTVNTGILYLPTYGNSGGDLTSLEMAAINSGASQISSFVGGAGNPALGGALFSMGESGAGAYGWLTTLIPGIIATDVGGGGIGTNITLTPAGSAAFPALTNTDLAGADPWHGHFSGNLGSLSVLGTALQGTNTRNIILGGGVGTVILPNPIPEPETYAMLLAGLGLLGFAARRRQLKAAAAA